MSERFVNGASDLCSGCTACVAICLREAIVMRSDADGFLRPIVDKAKCVGCEKCVKVCSVLSPYSADVTPLGFAAKACDLGSRIKSSSGAIFPALASAVIRRDGVVYGCVMHPSDVEAVHVRATTMDEVDAMRGSKYVQSDLGTTLRQCKDDLESGREVLFSGTPCQISGLKHFLGKGYDSLLTVEVFCHAVTSPKLFRKLKSEATAGKRTALTDVKFKEKNPSWHRSQLAFKFADVAENFSSDVYAHPYTKSFIENFSARPSCYKCQSRSGRSGADISLGDFWGIEKILPNFADDYGISAVVIHTKKGAAAFRELGELIESVGVSIDAITAENSSYFKQRSCPERARRKFMAMLEKHDIASAFTAAKKRPLWTRVLSRLNKIRGAGRF